MQTMIAASIFDPATWDRLSDAAFWRFVIVNARRELIADLPWMLPLSIACTIAGLSPPPRELVALFDLAIEDLKGLGFAVVARIAWTDDGIGLYVILANRNERTFATLVATQPMGQLPRRRRTPEMFLDFETTLTDGRELATANFSARSCFGYPPHARVEIFPRIKSPAVLYQLHRRSVEEFGGDEVRDLPELEDPIGWLRNEVMAQLAWQIESGFLYTGPSGEYHRLTWKGALLLSWTELWPVNVVRRARSRNRARRLLEQWGIDEPAA